MNLTRFGGFFHGKWAVIDDRFISTDQLTKKAAEIRHRSVGQYGHTDSHILVVDPYAYIHVLSALAYLPSIYFLLKSD